MNKDTQDDTLGRKLKEAYAKLQAAGQTNRAWLLDIREHPLPDWFPENLKEKMKRSSVDLLQRHGLDNLLRYMDIRERQLRENQRHLRQGIPSDAIDKIDALLEIERLIGMGKKEAVEYLVAGGLEKFISGRPPGSFSKLKKEVRKLIREHGRRMKTWDVVVLLYKKDWIENIERTDTPHIWMVEYKNKKGETKSTNKLHQIVSDTNREFFPEQ